MFLRARGGLRGTGMERPEIGGAGEVIERLREQEALLNRRVEAAREGAGEIMRKAHAEAPND